MQGCAPSIIFASFGAESVGGILEATNQILFWGCRFESFTDGALAIIGEGTNGIRFTDCKFESKLNTVPIVMAIGTFTASSFCNCYFYRPTSLFERDDGVNAKDVPMLAFIGKTATSTFSGNISMTDISDFPIKLEKSPIYISNFFSANEIKFKFTKQDRNGNNYIDDNVNFIESTVDINNNEIKILGH